jgi:hypothetical protein
LVAKHGARFGIFPSPSKSNEFHVLVSLIFLCGFLNLAAANAGCAHADALGSALHDGMHGLQVQVPAPFRDIVRMADFIAKPGAAPANFTYFRHGDFAPWMEVLVYQLPAGDRKLLLSRLAPRELETNGLLGQWGAGRAHFVKHSRLC